MNTQNFLRALLESRLERASLVWMQNSEVEIARGVDDTRMCVLFSQASRFAKARPLAPSHEDRSRATALQSGFDPERWTVRDALRVALLLARNDLAAPSGARAIDELFRYADIGEAQALYRALAHLPGAERFVARAREGARSNVRSHFEALACDSAYPNAHFDALAFRQLAIKALFIEAPLWRVHGFDARVDGELARMALDLADERRSAGRAVNPELWMCLGRFGGARGIQSIERELAVDAPRSRAAAALALARAGERERLTQFAARETNEAVRAAIADGLAGRCDQRAWRALDPSAASNREVKVRGGR